jgi:diguanylate cyclase (GGDEF)-like protein/PAS domain S-box-containing protein
MIRVINGWLKGVLSSRTRKHRDDLPSAMLRVSTRVLSSRTRKHRDGRHVISDGQEQNVPQSARSLQVALNAMPVGVAWANLANLNIVFMNRKFTELFGYKLNDFVDLRHWIAVGYPVAEDRALARETWRTYFTAPDHLEVDIPPIEVRILCKDGSIKTILQSGVILPENGWALSTFVDITDRKRDELLIQTAERRANENKSIYHLLLDHSPEMIILSPFDHSRRFVSPAVKQITGFTQEEYLRFKKWDMVHPLDREIAGNAIERLKNGELVQIFRYRALQKDGTYRWVEANVVGYVDPESRETAGYVATVRDVSEEKKREELSESKYRQLSAVASLDELTGIANRRAFNQTLEKEALRNSRSTSDLSLLLLDVDYFKQYNDLYGHLAGDTCLQKIALAVKQVLRREADLVARFGGEEFVVLLPMTDGTGAEVIARNILQKISALAIPHIGSPYKAVTISIGAACSRAGLPVNRSFLLDQADRALYQAKGRGRNNYCMNDEESSIPDSLR